MREVSSKFQPKDNDRFRSWIKVAQEASSAQSNLSKPLMSANVRKPGLSNEKEQKWAVLEAIGVRRLR